MRQEVIELSKLGPLPPSDDADVALLKKFEELAGVIQEPVTDEEARVLVRIFGPDECFGLAWTLVHLIETAPGWPLVDCLQDTEHEWVRRLRDRAIRGGRLK